MKLEQCNWTIIKAEDGKILRKKNTGRVVGDTVHLGYNYYEAGILLKKPYLAKPDDYEEIDLIVELDEDGNEIKVAPPDNTLKRLQMISKILSEEISNINSYNLSNYEKLTVKNLFPKLNEDIKEGDELEKGDVFLFKGDLYEVLTTHILCSHYFPSENTKHLYNKL